jgi:hypothetical protein
VNLVSDKKRRADGTLAPKPTVKTGEKYLPAKAGEGSHPISIERLRSLSGYFISQPSSSCFMTSINRCRRRTRSVAQSRSIVEDTGGVRQAGMGQYEETIIL